MEEANNAKKQPMTDEERLALAEKLDRELDEFIDKLPKGKYKDGWPEDRWQEEIEKHPFFMKKAPEPGQDVHPLYEGLQQLKYDATLNTSDDLAISYKDDGNFNFKHKKYRLAVLSYTEGIKVKCNNPEIEATLHNNRAAAQYFLQNYRSCLRDCEIALKHKPDYPKALVRAANACFEMEKYEQATQFCEKILDKDADNNYMQNLRQKCANAAKLRERNIRKKELLHKKKERDERLLIEEILKRKVNLVDYKGALSLEKLEPCFPELAHSRVHLNERQELVWPVVFLYPEYLTTDFVRKFCERDLMEAHISAIFEVSPEWDQERKYLPSNLNIYFENYKKNRVVLVESNKSLGEILLHKEYFVRGGTPSFIVLAKNSPAEKTFLEKY